MPPTTSTTTSTPASSFDSLDLDPRLLRAVAKLGFTTPTLIQSTAIPLALKGKDILARARTGSGKTVAYCLPVLQKVLSAKQGDDGAKRGVRALVLVPTRELAEQVWRVIKDLSVYCASEVVSVNLATADTALLNQRAILQELPDILIATPNRILSHLKASHVTLCDTLDTLVIDEADLILSYGHDADLRSLLPHLPRIHQSLLMSATMTSDVQELRQIILRNPAVLSLEDSDSHPAVDGESGHGDPLTQYRVPASEPDKFLLLCFLLKLKVHPFGTGKTIVFVADTDRCYKVRLFLEQFGVRSCALNGEMPVKSRCHVVEEFNRGVYDVIVATDEG
ncbi:ATP-dependent DNA/RNA helicase, partial [Irineochytrium annulatum]